MQLSLLLLAAAPIGCRHNPGITRETGREVLGTETSTDVPWIAPSVQLHGEPGQHIDSDFAAFRAHGGHPGFLFVSSNSQPEPYPQTWAHLPRMFVLSGDLPRGVHPILDVWDGASGIPFLDGFAAAGDVDRDGHMDVWSNTRKLYRGPFLGRQLTAADVLAEAECCWMPVLGDFDADGDGELDAVLGGGQSANIYYGPFDGTLPTWVDDPDITTLAHDAPPCSANRGAYLLEDYFGAGLDAIGVGTAGGDSCIVETRFYELTGPRGRRLSAADALVESESFRSGKVVFYALDVDGDGRPEVLSGLDRFLRVYQNPMAPWFLDTPIAWDVGRFVSDVVGDVNGDGHTDLVAEIEDEDGIWFGLVLGPFDTAAPIDAGVAIPLTPAGYDQPDAFDALYYNRIGEVALDIDGDGLTDLIDLQPGPDDAGYITIWYGADLVSAIDRRSQP